MLRTLEVFFLPPLLPLAVAGLSLLALRRWRRAAKAGLVLAAVLMWVMSLPIVGSALLRTLQAEGALDLAHLPPAQAIAVLSADMDVDPPEYGTQSVGPMTMQRLRYAAHLRRATGLPILVSGGRLPSHNEAHATSMRRVLEQELGVEVRWTEERSTTTAENARFSADILRQAGIHDVFVVTHAWHMPRAVDSFEHYGLVAHPAPTAFARWPTDPWVAWLPRWSGQRDVALALHEWLGRAYYAAFE
ncbi:MAG: YdcF family protein [Planctomycetota bacterium]